MDRLTYRDNDGFALQEAFTHMGEVVDRLADYEDAEERGELVRVVRCKDCRYCHSGYCERFDDLIPFGMAQYEDWENWYCADGKRRGDT